MTKQTLGMSDRLISRLAYGCMRIAGTWNPSDITPEREQAALTSLRAAYEAGYNLFDHADIYCQGACEEIHGKLLKDSPDLRRATVVATKCGIRRAGEPREGDPGRYDFSKNWIVSSCEGSLRRLGIECIDLYQLHRPDLLMQPEEVAEAFAALKTSGKVKWYGVSNFLPSQVQMLQKSLPDPLIVNQVEISLQRLDCFTDGTLDQCLMEGIIPLAWSPLAGGGIANGATSTVAQMGQVYDSKPACVALAWLLMHPSKIIPIIGSTKPENITSATKALDLCLSREDWYALYVAARGERMP